MKRIFLLIVSAVFITFGCTQLVCAQNPDDKGTQPRKRSGIFTMYALDPLSRSFCFNDGKEGMAIANNQFGNRCSDLSYALAGNGIFVAGIEVNRVAAIVDLGTSNQIRERYGFEDSDNGGVGFASLRLEGNKITVLQEDNTTPVWQPLKEGPQLFTDLKASANAPIKLGHIYLVRIADTKDKSFQQIVKLMVVSYRPEESVTLRWELMTK
ncbi:MAG TPA: hypothetical protein VFD62_16205 [Pyrinomonadaceae bacterium]|nr:hypothetical protein [Pyrinomonadaceae bacterium]